MRLFKRNVSVVLGENIITQIIYPRDETIFDQIIIILSEGDIEKQVG